MALLQISYHDTVHLEEDGHGCIWPFCASPIQLQPTVYNIVQKNLNATFGHVP